MKRKVVVSLLSSVLACVVLLMIAAGVGAQGPDGEAPQSIGPAVLTGTPISSTFTYQGQLKSSGNAVSGLCDFHFGMWDAADVGAQVGVTQTLTAVNVVNGLFTVPLDFGAMAFNGDARWLAMAVRCPGGSGNYAPLNPRQSITPAPYAAYASGNWSLTGNRGTSANNFLGTTDNTTLTLGVSNTAALRLIPNFRAPILIGGYAGNAVNGAGVGSTIAGGGDSEYGANVISGTSLSWATISGGMDNLISGGNLSVIAGGASNQINGLTFSSVIDGGQFNQIGGSAYISAIGGGSYNQISGGADGSAIGGGGSNLISGTAVLSTIGGGLQNQISGTNTALSTIGGGSHNTISSTLATIPGGYYNAAAGNYSFAAGRQAKANHNGAFVWGDSTNADFASTGNNQFLIRANGGVGVGNNAPAAQLHVSSNGGGAAPQLRLDQTNLNDYVRLRMVVGSDTSKGWDVATISTTFTFYSGYAGQDALKLTPGGVVDYMTMGNGAHLTAGGAWTNASDRSVKANFAPVDGRAVLDKVLDLPISTWNYKAEDAATRHLGPVAQDFHAAFDLGSNDTSISTVDEEGVALAAIQGLAQVMQDKDQRITQLENEVAQLKRVAPFPDLSFNFFNLISPLVSVIALGGVIVIGLRQKRGGTR